MSWTRHRATYRELQRNLWSVGCACGWLADHPLRGDKARARSEWKRHAEAVELAATDRLMRQASVGAKARDL